MGQLKAHYTAKTYSIFGSSWQKQKIKIKEL